MKYYNKHRKEVHARMPHPVFARNRIYDMDKQIIQQFKAYIDNYSNQVCSVQHHKYNCIQLVCWISTPTKRRVITWSVQLETTGMCASLTPILELAAAKIFLLDHQDQRICKMSNPNLANMSTISSVSQALICKNRYRPFSKLCNLNI